MAERSRLLPDGEERRRIMDFIMAAGQTLLENGAEVFRAEQTMQIMAASLHLREFRAYVLTNGIFASAGTAEISDVRYVPERTVHLGRVAAVNELSRELAAGKLGLDEAELRLAEARRIPFPDLGAQAICGAAGSAVFALMFGGSAGEAFAAAAAGGAASVYLWLCGRFRLPAVFQKLTGAALITLVCIGICLGIGASVSHAVIGALMLLTPGVAFTMSIRDFVHGDYLSGTIRLIDALLVAACLACGTGFVLRLYTMITGAVVT